MSDYLKSIVARNLEIAPRLEPRLASTFEPPPRHGGGIGRRVDVSPIDGDEEIERAPVRSATSPRRAAGESGAAEHPLTQNEALPSQAPVQPLPAGQPRPSLAPAARAAIARTPEPTPVPIATGSVLRIAPGPIAPLDHDQHAGAESNSDPRPPATKPRHSRSQTLDRAENAAVSDHHGTATTAASPTVQQPVRVSASVSGGAIVQRAPAASASAPPADRGVVSSVSAARSDVTGSRAKVSGSREVAPVPPVTADATIGTPRSESVARPSSADRETNAVPSEGIEPSPIRSTVVPAQRGEPIAVAARQPAAWPSFAPPVAETPTTIHVTIGRIEVKATPPAKAQPCAAAPAASSSLDEYLRRRADRGDR